MLRQRTEDGIVIASFANGNYNTITRETITQLRDLVRGIQEDAGVKGLVLTGQGKVFCSGFDLSMFLSFKDLDDIVSFFEWEDEILCELFTCRKPVVTAINGAAVAGGLIYSMATDYRIVTNHPKIKLGMSEIKLGLGMTVAHTEIMRFGLETPRRFREILFEGALHGVEQAKELGLVDEVVPGERLLDRAKEIVLGWASNPGSGFGSLKTSYRKPIVDRIRALIQDGRWRGEFTTLLEERTRATLEKARKMMES